MAAAAWPGAVGALGRVAQLATVRMRKKTPATIEWTTGPNLFIALLLRAGSRMTIVKAGRGQVKTEVLVDSAKGAGL
jgi:hypothetical protein